MIESSILSLLVPELRTRLMRKLKDQDGEDSEALTGMPKTDLSPWLTSPLAIVKVVQTKKIARRKERRWEVSRMNTGDGEEKEKRKRRGGRGERKILPYTGTP